MRLALGEGRHSITGNVVLTMTGEVIGLPFEVRGTVHVNGQCR
jgi:hypothetical protein